MGAALLRAVQSAWLASESAMGMSVIPDFILPVLTNLGGLSRPSSTYAQPMSYSQSLAAMRHFLTIPGKIRPSPSQSRLKKVEPSPCTASRSAC